MKVCACEQYGRIHGTVRSTKLEDLEHDVANLKRSERYVTDLYRWREGFLDDWSLLKEDLNKPQHIMDFIKSWIRHWLGVRKIGNDY